MSASVNYGNFGERKSASDKSLNWNRITFVSKGVIKFVPIQEIRWVKAEQNYVRIAASGKTHVVRETMANMEAKLSAAPFVRIHRSRLVNLVYVKEIKDWRGRQHAKVIMQDGSVFPLSRGCRKNIRQLLH